MLFWAGASNLAWIDKSAPWMLCFASLNHCMFRISGAHRDKILFYLLKLNFLFTSLWFSNFTKLVFQLSNFPTHIVFHKFWTSWSQPPTPDGFRQLSRSLHLLFHFPEISLTPVHLVSSYLYYKTYPTFIYEVSPDFTWMVPVLKLVLRKKICFSWGTGILPHSDNDICVLALSSSFFWLKGSSKLNCFKEATCTIRREDFRQVAWIWMSDHWLQDLGQTIETQFHHL